MPRFTPSLREMDISIPISSDPLVRMQGISKRFGPVEVLHKVDFDVLPGEVHVLAGENGAGKSTLIKILGGVHQDFIGTIEIAGASAHPNSPQEANALGVAVIFQELSLVPTLNVTNNIFLGRPLTRIGFVRDTGQTDATQALLRQLDIPVRPDQLVEDLPIAQQQMVEIAKALAQNARILVMDEPTSALTAPEVEHLFHLIAQLKSKGCGIVYITHKMEEIDRIADRITVLRDGCLIGTAAAADLPTARLVEWMVGCPLDHQFPTPAPRTTAPAERLGLENFSLLSDLRPGAPPLIANLSLRVHEGEVLGVAGLQGSGASPLFHSLFGAGPYPTRGQIRLDDEPITPNSPRQALDHRIALLTNDRKATGLVLSLSTITNAILPSLGRLCHRGWRRPAQETSVTEKFADRLSLRSSSLDLEVNTLSGGNQQKVMLAKWLMTQPRVLLLDEPTRGIDVGAKREIYRIIHELTREGVAIMLITSELPELIGLSHRIIVLHRGKLTAEFTRAEATPSRILAAAMGQPKA